MSVVVFKIRFSDAIYSELHWNASGDLYGKLRGLFFELKQNAGFTSIAYYYVRCSLVSKLESLVLEPQILTLDSILKVFKFQILNRVLQCEISSNCQSSALHCTLTQ